jgi:hemerythrin-like domain-containing protein
MRRRRRLAQSLRQPPHTVNKEHNMTRNTSSKTSTKSTSSHRAHAKSTHPDALDILAEDHKKVLKMFDQFKKMKKQDDADEEEIQTLVETACAELTIHTRLEEEIFYPALRDAIDDTDMLDEAEVEHASAKQLITELSAMQPGDDLYEAKFTVLGEYVKHHIGEEEDEMFPKAKKAKLDLEAMGDEINARKAELRDELGVADEADEEDEEEKASRSETTRRSVH